MLRSLSFVPEVVGHLHCSPLCLTSVLNRSSVGDVQLDVDLPDFESLFHDELPDMVILYLYVLCLPV